MYVYEENFKKVFFLKKIQKAKTIQVDMIYLLLFFNVHRFVKNN